MGGSAISKKIISILFFFLWKNLFFSNFSWFFSERMFTDRPDSGLETDVEVVDSFS